MSVLDGAGVLKVARRLTSVERPGVEHARGAVLAAEWLRERGRDPEPLRQHASAGALSWLHWLGSVAVGQRRMPGEGAVWLPPVGVDDQWRWWRSLHCLQALERVFPGSVDWLITRGERVQGDLRGTARIVWVPDGADDPLAEVLWKAAKKA